MHRCPFESRHLVLNRNFYHTYTIVTAMQHRVKNGPTSGSCRGGGGGGGPIMPIQSENCQLLHQKLLSMALFGLGMQRGEQILSVAFTGSILPSLALYCPHWPYIALTGRILPSLALYCPHWPYIALTGLCCPH